MTRGSGLRGASVEEMVERARGGDPRAVARLISLVEDASPQLREVTAALVPYAGNALVVGITGSPGVGKSTCTSALVTAMRKANFNSLRGPFQYNVNHHPIQNFYLLRAEKQKNGEIEMKIQKTVFEKHKDSYYQDCKMKW